MTAHEKYLKGIEMEQAGKTPHEIAAELELRDRQAWYNLKSTHKKQEAMGLDGKKKKQEALEERANKEAGMQIGNSPTVGEKAWLEECAEAQAKKRPEYKTTVGLAMEKAQREQLQVIGRKLEEAIKGSEEVRDAKLPETVKMRVKLEAEDPGFYFRFDGEELMIEKQSDDDWALTMTEAEWTQVKTVVDAMIERYTRLIG